MRLIYGGLSLERLGLYGFRLCANGDCLCVDANACDRRLYTHDHHRDGEGIGPQGLEPWRQFEVDKWLVTPIPAYNTVKRPDGGVPHPMGCCFGYLIERAGVKVLIAGDTDLTPELTKTRGVDILAVPIGGGGVMTPEEAAEAVMSIRPKIAVPYHYTDRKHYVLFRDIAQPYTQIIGV
ncbi:MAG: MBL fold metallo-hydrolase [Thermoproteus sp.]